MKSCIYGLVRGYKDLSKYNQLINRNLSISKFINFNNHDMIIFHEGNIEKEHQSHIRSKSKNEQIKFINIKKDFENSDSEIVAHENLTNNSPGGHSIYLGAKNMFRFYSMRCFAYLDEYDYIMRADEDILFANVLGYDIFDFMKSNNLILGYGYRKIDGHPLATTIIPYIKKYIEQKQITTHCSGKEININHFYSNLSIYKTSFWKKPECLGYLKYMHDSEGIYSKRWGDHIIHSNAIKMFSHPDQWHRFKDLQYQHQSLAWDSQKNIKQEWEIDRSKYK